MSVRALLIAVIENVMRTFGEVNWQSRAVSRHARLPDEVITFENKNVSLTMFLSSMTDLLEEVTSENPSACCI